MESFELFVRGYLRIFESRCKIRIRIVTSKLIPENSSFELDCTTWARVSWITEIRSRLQPRTMSTGFSLVILILDSIELSLCLRHPHNWRWCLCERASNRRSGSTICSPCGSRNPHTNYLFDLIKISVRLIVALFLLPLPRHPLCLHSFRRTL